MAWKGTIPQSESPFDPIYVFLFRDSAYPLFPFIMTKFSGVENIEDQSSSVINGLMHVSQSRIHLVHWKPVLDAHNVLWVLIYPLLSFISSFSITELLRVREGKNSRIEPCVSWETSTTCDKEFVIQVILEWKESHIYPLML